MQSEDASHCVYVFGLFVCLLLLFFFVFFLFFFCFFLGGGGGGGGGGVITYDVLSDTESVCRFIGTKFEARKPSNVRVESCN